MEAVLAVVVATGIGYWVDSRYGTEPLWLIVGAVVGFASMVLRLLRMGKLIEDPSFGGPGADESGPAARHADPDDTRSEHEETQRSDAPRD